MKPTHLAALNMDALKDLQTLELQSGQFIHTDNSDAATARHNMQGVINETTAASSSGSNTDPVAFIQLIPSQGMQ